MIRYYDIHGRAYVAPRLATAAAAGALRPIANACGHWSPTGLPIRHVDCRDLPLAKCAR